MARRGAYCDVGELSATPEKIKKQFFKYNEYTWRSTKNDTSIIQIAPLK